MKKFLIIYILFSIIFGALIYFYTLIVETNERTVDVFYDLAENAFEDGEIDRFVKYQSVAYRRIDLYEDDTYDIYFYQVIAQLEDEYVNQFSALVFPKKDVNHATRSDDKHDSTGIILTDREDEETIYRTDEDEDFEEIAVSYGIARFGFYYYAVELEEDLALNATLTDYADRVILDHDLDFTYLDYPDEVPADLNMGFSNREIEELLDLPTYLQPAMFQNITIFLAIDIFIGGIIYQLLKKKNEERARQGVRKNEST
ncbi:MAG: hypothetical protein ACLFTZ_05555 [Acholeplasmataceae bacterium]